MGNVPRLRFPGFEGNWLEKTIESSIDFLSGFAFKAEDISDDISGVPLLRGINITEGRIRHTAEMDRYFCGDTTKYRKYFLEEDDLVIGMDGSKVGRNSALIGKIDAGSILIQRVARLRKTEKTSLNFIYHLINSSRFHTYVDEVKTSSGIPHISSHDIKNFKISFPGLEEQQKVSAFITCIDDRASGLKKRKALLEKYKKGMMQKIFSQEVRFKDEDGGDFGEWMNVVLGDCLDYEQPTNYLVKTAEYDDSFKTPVLTAGKTFLLGYTNEKAGIFNKNLPVIIFDDFTTATQFVDFPFKAKSSAMKILKAKNGINIKFIYESMQMIDYEIGGHGRHWISVFSQLEILLPSVAEQTKIAHFLSAIDDKINLVAQQIETMEGFKKGLLGEMFV